MPISKVEILHHIKTLKSGKSPGPDNITNEALKFGAPILVTYLTILFNMNIYSNSVGRIKLENKGRDIRIERGVRQGDPLSPKLFIAVLEDEFKGIEWNNNGLWIRNKHLTHLRFADDIAVFSDTATKLDKMLQTLDRESQKVGLYVNTTKTRILSNSVCQPIRVSLSKVQVRTIDLTLRVDSKPIEYVNNYVYLGKQVSFDMNSSENEVDRRINVTWKKYWTHKEILKGNYSQLQYNTRR
ncbi:unnamed protein product [Pieris macdunnoughi]|uniref:Reverse transcriptase domain-containing protein n=1 Tax=Pieris macdunnoughi TaxID=345717 RepID=A0A821MBR1_9NEOP|nr:unnamed protein product [Pieris macdunnoughi]